jgi:hypothetical protein
VKEARSSFNKKNTNYKIQITNKLQIPKAVMVCQKILSGCKR